MAQTPAEVLKHEDETCETMESSERRHLVVHLVVRLVVTHGDVAAAVGGRRYEHVLAVLGPVVTSIHHYGSLRAQT